MRGCARFGVTGNTPSPEHAKRPTRCRCLERAANVLVRMKELSPQYSRRNVLRRHQPGIVTKPFELATEMMRPDTSLHPDQAGRHIG